MTEHLGRLRADQVVQDAVGLGGVQARQPAQQLGLDDRRRGVVRRDLRDLGEQPGRAGGGEHVQEPRPVHVGDGQRDLVVVQAPAQRARGHLGVQERQAAPAQPGQVQPAGQDQVVGEARRVPHAPGDRRRRQPAGPAAAREGVEVGVGGGVGAVVATAPHARDGREQHERVQVGVGQRDGEVLGAHRLRVEAAREVAQRRGGQRPQLHRGRGVHHRADRRALVGQAAHQRGHGDRVGDVADGGGEPDTGQVEVEFGATTAGQHDVLRTGTRQPAHDVRADRAGAAGDQHRAGRSPRPPLRGGGLRPYQAADQDTLPAHGQLVLVTARGEGLGEQRGSAVDGHVDQTAPRARVLQRGDAADAPHGGGGRVDVLGALRHGVPGDRPQRAVHAGVQQCLQQERGQREPGRQGRVLGVVAVGEGEQREHTGHRTGGQQTGERGPVREAGHLHDQRGVEGLQCPSGVEPGRHDDQPRTRDAGGRLRGQGTPRLAVAPAVHDGRLLRPAAPRRQRLQRRGERLGGGVERVGQRVEVLAVDGVPEGVVHRVGHGGRAQPEVLVLERVRGQLDPPAAAAEHTGPVHRDAVHPGPRGGFEQPVPAAFVAAQRAGHRDLAAQPERGLLDAGHQHRVRARLHEHADPSPTRAWTTWSSRTRSRRLRNQ